MKKNMLTYIRKNLESLNYVVSVECKLVKGKLVKKQLKVKEINQFINYIKKMDIQSSKIGLLMKNSNSFVAAFYAISAIGKIPVPINNYVKVDELNDIIEKNELDYIIISNDFIDLSKNSNIKKIINMDTIDVSDELDVTEFLYLEKEDDDVFVISYTSGTSGNYSKGVELTYKNITFVSKEYQKVYGLSRKSKIITVLPLWHNYAMFSCLTSSIVSKSALVLMNEWDANLFLEINKELNPDVFPGSPYMYIDLINNYHDQLFTLKHLKVCDSGGDSLPIECISKFEQATGAIITEGYGLTETASLTHFNYSASERKVGSLGKPVSQTKCKILDLSGKKVPIGQWGLLWIKGPMVFKDYVKLPGQVEKVKKNNWFNTNDVVKCDENGFYYIAGRLSDLKQINDDDNKLRDLENELYKFDGIRRVHVQTNYNAVADFHYFDIYVILKNDYKIQDLYDYINLNLKQFVVGEVKEVSDLPTTGTGKIKRKEIAEFSNINKDEYDFKELFGGLRCRTFLITNKKDSTDKKIYQEYYDSAMYQAEKKYNITKMVKMHHKTVLIPDAYGWGIDDKKSWLLTEYITGKTLADIRKADFSLLSIVSVLAKTLYSIHNTKASDKFGWITNKSIISYDTFSEYLSSELHRFQDAVAGIFEESDMKYMVQKAETVIKRVQELDDRLQPELLWFDLNPNNILVDFQQGKYQLSGIIDAGGAKYGIKEWDLAFLKMEVCTNKEEFDSIIKEYQKLNQTIDLELVDLLCVFIELDDMIVRVLDKVYLPVPYDTNFLEIIKKFSKDIESL